MDLIIETDIGYDPDDFFAICYLIAAGAKIRLLNITPGSRRQVAIVRFMFKHLGLDIPIGVHEPDFVAKTRDDMHSKLLIRNKAPLSEFADGKGDVLFKAELNKYPDAQIFLIGPIRNLNEYLKTNNLNNNRVVMQGGFVGFDIHGVPCKRIPRFEGYSYFRTTNMNGCIDGVMRLLKTDAKKFFIGKNITNLAIYNRDIHDFFEGATLKEAMKLFVEAADIYFEKRDSKKFHDPLAAVALMHPDIFRWINGELRYKEGTWGTFLSNNNDNKMAVDVDIDSFWEYIIGGE